MEKYDEIINAINMINKQAYNKTDNVLKDLMRFIFTSFGEINEGAFEFIYEYAIKDSLMNFYNFAKENNLKEEVINSSLTLPGIGYMKEGNSLRIILDIDPKQHDSFMIEINPSNKTINIYCLNKKYYLKGESIACYECAKAYEYCYNENNRVEVSSPTTICDCFFNEDGLMSKKEITITYDDALFMEITRKQVFVKYFLEQGNYKEVENILLSYKEKLKALPILHDDKFKVIFERNNECFTIVNKSLQCLISDNIVYEDKKEIYLNPENRLYDLNCFDDICSKDENYLNGIEKEENKKLKETYLRRLRSLD